MAIHIELIQYLAQFARKPLGFVLAAFPWGEGVLEGQWPQQWQMDVLRDIEESYKDDPYRAIQHAIASGHGVGKGCTLYTDIDTPEGNRKWGDLKPGNYVFGGDGAPVQILATNTHKAPIYRVTFDDGTASDVSSGHLWTVKGRQQRRKGQGWITLSTMDILNRGVKRPNGKATARQWEIPQQGAVMYPHKETALHPYLMGVWLGDGSKSAPSYGKPYPEIAGKICSLGYDVVLRKDNVQVYIKGIKHLMTDEIFSCGSHARYIPDEYKYNDVESRKALLCGLLDTDGEIGTQSSIGYSTTSKRLAEDIVWLVRSLGGKAKIQPTTKHSWYYNDRREKVPCRDCYRLTISLDFNPFTIERRKKRYKPHEKRYLTRWIDSIEYIGIKPMMCIEVDRKDGLYLANDFIVTHNSALVSWLILWAMTTHVDTRGVITANTDTQLKSKTWAELATWYNRFLCKDIFTLTATSLFSVEAGHDRTWRIDAIPWSERNTEAFAGLHNQGKRILVIFDEASAIIDKIWEVTEGAMMDANTEKLWLAFGNPTRTSGRFFDCFHKERKIWHTRRVDSREVTISDKAKIEGWKELHGEDSDFFKVRVKGEFPSASVRQFISTRIVEEAIDRIPRPEEFKSAPVIIGVDPAWTGEDAFEIVLRQGNFYKHLASFPKNDDDGRMAGYIARLEDEYKASAVFIDQGYGQGLYSFGKAMGRMWRLVPFGSKPFDDSYVNKRVEMWADMRQWLLDGGALEDDQQLKDDLTGPEAFINRNGKLQLESKEDMKKRGLPSPNKADALALTFAYPVFHQEAYMGMNTVNTDYDPFA